MTLFGSISRDGKKLFGNLRDSVLPNPLAQSLVLTVFLLFFFSFLYQFSPFSLRIRLLEEKVRQYFWYYLASKKDPVLPIAILDLYTSESPDASEKYYEERYGAYDLAKNLEVFCGIGVKTVFFDVYLDELSWMGKFLSTKKRFGEKKISPQILEVNKKEFRHHIEAGEQAAKKLTYTLSCFENILIAVRDNPEKGKSAFYPPIQLFEEHNNNVQYVHINTEESRLYPFKKTFEAKKGEGVYPYAAVPLAEKLDLLQKEDFPHERIPLQFFYHPLSFAKFLFNKEEMDLYHKEAKKRKISYEEKALWFGEPHTLLVGFTRDTTDQHDLPFDLGEPYFLPGSFEKEPSVILPNPKPVTQAKKPPFTNTPGLFAILSTANSLAENKIPRYPVHTQPIFSLFLFGLIVWFSLEFSRRIANKKIQRFFFAGLFLSYFIVNAIVFTQQIYLPLFLPFGGLLTAMYLRGIMSPLPLSSEKIQETSTNDRKFIHYSSFRKRGTDTDFGGRSQNGSGTDIARGTDIERGTDTDFGGRSRNGSGVTKVEGLTIGCTRDENQEKTQEIETQEIETQEIETQEIETQELERQELERQELERQELERQELEKQEREKQELEKQELEKQELEKFHSGKKLSLARNLWGFCQESILGEEPFPLIDVRTLRRWESGGIPKKRLEEIAGFFKLEIKDFLEDMTEKQFQELLLRKKGGEFPSKLSFQSTSHQEAL